VVDQTPQPTCLPGRLICACCNAPILKNDPRVFRDPAWIHLRCDFRRQEEPPSRRLATTGPSRILIVENEAPARELLRQVAELGGHTADAVPHGAAALARFQAGVYHAVITDFLMPGITGLELAQIIRRLDPAVAIIMVSGSTLPVERVLEEYGIQFLSKPLDLTRLTEAISLGVDRTRAGRQKDAET